MLREENKGLLVGSEGIRLNTWTTLVRTTSARAVLQVPRPLSRFCEPLSDRRKVENGKFLACPHFKPGGSLKHG